jgi:hypothetical protein
MPEGFTSCNTVEECEPEPPEPGDEGCIPGDVTAGGGSATFPAITYDRCEGFDWGYRIDVWARVPPHRVQVDPFPRWLVAMGAPLPEPFESGEPGRLTLQDYPAYSPFPGFCGPNGPGGAGGCWSNDVSFPDPVRTGPAGDEAPRPGDVKGYHIGLRWRRLDRTPGDTLGPVPPVCWDFDEREWNVGEDYGYGRISNVACGTAVEHVYETSSWDKPRNGPNFLAAADVCPGWTPACLDRTTFPPAGRDPCHCCAQVPTSMQDWQASGYPYDAGLGPWQNPAYQVRVPTYWAAEWKVEWWAWEVVGSEWDECGCTGLAPGPFETWRACADRPAGVCTGAVASPPTEWWGQFGEPRYGWVKHENGWNLLDLRSYGSGTWYYQSWSVVTTGAFAGCNFEYGDPNPGTTVRVPVVEVQSVLVDPCRVDGTCPEGYPWWEGLGQ